MVKTELEKRLEKIEDYYDLDSLLSSEKHAGEIAKYYRFSDFFYKWIHARGTSSIHMALSNDGKFHKQDFYEQTKIVAEYINGDTKNVLELGAGRVFHSKYLAKLFPNVNFTALDLPDRNFLKNKVPKNIKLIEGDYNDLSTFKAGSIDLVFAIETICHAENKEKVVKQIQRVLRPGGLLIITDVYEPLPQTKMTGRQKYISAITLAGMRVTSKDNYIGNMKKYLVRNNFVAIKITDMTERIHPTLQKLERIAKFYFTHPIFANLLRRTISDYATQNSISGYLMPLTFDGRTIHQYNLVEAKKVDVHESQ